jgi:hypothetical protein
MNLYKCGTHVRTNMGLIEGMVTAICIRFDAVTYEISYFTDGVQKVIWMNEDEFKTIPERKRKSIGYNQA